MPHASPALTGGGANATCPNRAACRFHHPVNLHTNRGVKRSRSAAAATTADDEDEDEDDGQTCQPCVDD